MKNLHTNFTLLLVTSVGFLSALTLSPRNKIGTSEGREKDDKDVVVLHHAVRGFPDNESSLVYELAHQQTLSDSQHSQVGEIHSKNRHKPRKVKQITYRFVARQKFTAGGNQKQNQNEEKVLLQDPVVRNEKSVESLSYGENVIAKSEALQQVNSGLDSSVPKMVVTIATTVAALFGMCVMAAIFQCCCRKKRREGDTDDAKSDKSSETRRSKSPSPVKQKLVDSDGLVDDKSEGDQLLVDDELGDFSMVQRETEILKSYRKPPPPKNRARASRPPKIKCISSEENSSVSAVIDEEPSGSTSSRQGSQRTSPEKKTENDENETTNKQSDSTDEENKVSFSTAQTLLESVLSEAKGQVTDNAVESKTVSGQTTPSSSRKPSAEDRNTNTEQSGASSMLCDSHTNGGNIFLQIDPTVKRKENMGSKNTSKIPVKQSAPTEGAKRRPPSDHKEQRKFIVPSVHGDQMDQLVQSLKSKMKEDTSQSARNLSVNKVSPTRDDEDLKPVGRDRCYSDPTKQNALNPTHV
ncbi:uncharacterized protein LOC121379926 isoform X2 [Gigantopelta aegis]|uniref:uncharacterized protein LOC121379926 isoform X2 n=1 Tax=Gigantopelta aegis TaxID=1735272 RepID=UPI001B88C4DA|nr:uncharacterized protein LOC121379926 isoform X2 [Gigantopelta aegis]